MVVRHQDILGSRISSARINASNDPVLEVERLLILFMASVLIIVLSMLLLGSSQWSNLAP